MTPEMQAVVWIAWVGALLLFAALAGLVGLMYLLTSPLWFDRRARGATRASTNQSAAETHEADESERRRRAAALVVAVACGEADSAPLVSADAPSDWRLLNRSLRLRQHVTRRDAGR